MVQALNTGPQGIGHFLANVPKTIDQALDRPPVSDLLRNGAKQNVIEATLAAEIMKASNMLTVGGNLREGQALQIAIQLIEDFPNESLEDFCLCLRRGIKGIYGDIFRFDVLVISGWFQKYLDEKYVAIENKLMDEKDKVFEPLVPNFSLPPSQTLTEEARRQKEKERLKAWLDAVKAVDDKKIAPLTEKDIRKEGQQKPKVKLHPPTTLSQAHKHELHLEWCRCNFDKYTADKLPTWKPEQEWIESLSETEKERIYKAAIK